MRNKEKFDDRLEAGSSGTKAVVVKSGKKKKAWIIILLLVLIVVAVFVVRSFTKVKQDVEMVGNQTEVVPVEKRDLSDTISLKGSIAGISKTNVTSKALSEITSLNVQLGDVVKTGDLLCTLDSVSIEERIAELQKTISNSNAVSSINNKQAREAVEQAQRDQNKQLEEAQLEITRAREAFDGTQMLYNQGEADFPTLLAAERAIETAEKNYENVLESTNRAIQSAQNALKLDSYQDSDSTQKDTLKSLKEQLDDCEIKAPCGGVVTAINVSVGDINAEKVTILTIEDTSSLKLVATVSEADILKIQEGMKAVITADATGEEEIEGEVTRVVRVKGEAGAGGDQAAGGGYSVELSVKNKELLVGMAAKAKVMIQDRGAVLAVPYDMIRYDESGATYVLTAVLNDDGTATAVRKDITTGDEIDYYTEVTGGDLEEGDLLVCDYTGMITDGQNFSPAVNTFGGEEGGDLPADGMSGTAGSSVEVE